MGMGGPPTWRRGGGRPFGTSFDTPLTTRSVASSRSSAVDSSRPPLGGAGSPWGASPSVISLSGGGTCQPARYATPPVGTLGAEWAGPCDRGGAPRAPLGVLSAAPRGACSPAGLMSPAWVASVFALQGESPAPPVRAMDITVAVGEGDGGVADTQLVDGVAIRMFVEEELRGVSSALLLEPQAVTIPLPMALFQLPSFVAGIEPAPAPPPLSI